MPLQVALLPTARTALEEILGDVIVRLELAIWPLTRSYDECD